MFQNLLNPDWIMKNGGLYLVLLILFVETGIILGFFLPGDPLLFVAGMVIASAEETPHPFESDILNLIFWMILFAVATILGYFIGFWFGKRFGHKLQKQKDNWIFKKQHIETAHDFYVKKGTFAICVSRFLPIVRTFAPIIAGMVDMNRRKFISYNLLGAVLWVGGITGLGFVLGENQWVRTNLEFVIIGLVLIVTTPVLLKMILPKREQI